MRLSVYWHVLRIEVIAHRALEFGSPFTKHVGKVLEIVAGSQTEFANKVLSSCFQITIIFLGDIVLRSTKVCIGRDGCGAFET